MCLCVGVHICSQKKGSTYVSKIWLAYMPVICALGFNEDMIQALSISILILDAPSALYKTTPPVCFLPSCIYSFFSWCFQIMIIDDSWNHLGLSTGKLSTSTGQFFPSESDVQSWKLYLAEIPRRRQLVINCPWSVAHISKNTLIVK